MGVVVEELYDNLEWYKSLRKFREWNERAMWAILALLGRPQGHLDMGCGDSSMLRVSKFAGVKNVLGIEVSSHARTIAPQRVHVMVRDLTQPLEKLRGRFDLVTCIEVAEHVTPEGTDIFLDNVTRNVAERLIFTAAPPGQDGTGHINCRPAPEWVDMIEGRGLHYNDHLTERLKDSWIYATGPMFWLPQNVMVFGK